MSDNETLKLAELLERCGDAEAFGVRAWRYRKEILAALRAVNSHADLVAALEDIASTFDAGWLSGSVERCVGDRACAALAKANGELK